MSVKVNYGPLTEIQMQEDEIAEVVSEIQKMPPNGIMAEWGSGGSTVKWLESMQADQRLITVEHNRDWHSKVDQYIITRDDLNDRFKFHLREEKDHYKHGYASVNEEHPTGLEDYFFPDDDILDADIFFIDGIGRAATSMLVKMLARKENPVIYIHDYYGREKWYRWATQFFSSEKKVGRTLARFTL